MTLPHAICEGLWRSPTPPCGFQGVHKGALRALVSVMSTPERPREGPREHVIYEGSRAQHIFGAHARVKCVQEAQMTKLVAQSRFHTLFARVCSARWRFHTLFARLQDAQEPRTLIFVDRDASRGWLMRAPPLQNARRRSTVEGVRGR